MTQKLSLLKYMNQKMKEYDELKSELQNLEKVQNLEQKFRLFYSKFWKKYYKFIFFIFSNF